MIHAARFRYLPSLATILLLTACSPSDPESLAFSGEAGMATESDSAEAEASTGESDDGPLLDLGDEPPSTVPGGDIPTTCEEAAAARTSVGCEFFAADLPNTQPEQQWGIAVSNVQESQAATATLEQRVDGAWQVLEGPVDIAPLDSHLFLPPTMIVEDSGLLAGGALRVTTDLPTIAYEFNPVDAFLSHSSDAALLYPVDAWDYDYEVVDYAGESGSWGAFVVVVAAKDGTVIEVTPSADTHEGPGVPAGYTGQPFTLHLDAGDMAQVEVMLDLDLEPVMRPPLSGTLLSSDPEHPFGVFNGNICAVTELGACDHLAEMLTGVRLWGTSYVAGRMPIRRPEDPEPTLWKIYASEADTTIVLDAPAEVTGLPPSPIQLDAGESVEFEATGTPETAADFAIDADKPIAVISVLVGMMPQVGDPAMLMLSPTEQFLPRYVVYVPQTWSNDFLIVTRSAGAPVELDGQLIPDASFSPVGAGDHEVARIPAADGVHVIDGLGQPVGTSVIGYDTADGYAYVGGTGTYLVNPDPG